MLLTDPFDEMDELDDAFDLMPLPFFGRLSGSFGSALLATRRLARVAGGEYRNWRCRLFANCFSNKSNLP